MGIGPNVLTMSGLQAECLKTEVVSHTMKSNCMFNVETGKYLKFGFPEWRKKLFLAIN